MQGIHQDSGQKHSLPGQEGGNSPAVPHLRRDLRREASQEDGGRGGEPQDKTKRHWGDVAGFDKTASKRARLNMDKKSEWLDLALNNVKPKDGYFVLD